MTTAEVCEALEYERLERLQASVLNPKPENSNVQTWQRKARAYDWLVYCFKIAETEGLDGLNDAIKGIRHHHKDVLDDV
jgi:hypothetical protein